MTNNRAAADAHQEYKVRPDSLRVSYFYRALEFKNDRQGFRRTLGTLFIPAWTQLTAPLGLTAYVPSVPPKTDLSAQVPDEIAIVFFESQEVYKALKKSVGGRLCGRTLHSSVFAWQEDPSPVRKSSSGFPSRMPDPKDGEIEFQPDRDKTAQAARAPRYTGYYLFDNDADWQGGATRVFVGLRPQTLDPDEYRRAVQQAFYALRQDRPAGLEGLLFVPLEDCLIYWAHWRSEEEERVDRLADLNGLFSMLMNTLATPKVVPTSMSRDFEGFGDIRDGDSYAIQFGRRHEQEHKQPLNTDRGNS